MGEKLRVARSAEDRRDLVPAERQRRRRQQGIRQRSPVAISGQCHPAHPSQLRPRRGADGDRRERPQRQRVLDTRRVRQRPSWRPIQIAAAAQLDDEFRRAADHDGRLQHRGRTPAITLIATPYQDAWAAAKAPERPPRTTAPAPRTARHGSITCSTRRSASSRSRACRSRHARQRRVRVRSRSGGGGVQGELTGRRHLLGARSVGLSRLIGPIAGRNVAEGDNLDVRVAHHPTKVSPAHHADPMNATVTRSLGAARPPWRTAAMAPRAGWPLFEHGPTAHAPLQRSTRLRSPFQTDRDRQLRRARVYVPSMYPSFCRYHLLISAVCRAVYGMFRDPSSSCMMLAFGFACSIVSRIDFRSTLPMPSGE